MSLGREKPAYLGKFWQQKIGRGPALKLGAGAGALAVGTALDTGFLEEGLFLLQLNSSEAITRFRNAKEIDSQAAQTLISFDAKTILSQKQTAAGDSVAHGDVGWDNPYPATHVIVHAVNQNLPAALDLPDSDIRWIEGKNVAVDGTEVDGVIKQLDNLSSADYGGFLTISAGGNNVLHRLLSHRAHFASLAKNPKQVDLIELFAKDLLDTSAQVRAKYDAVFSYLLNLIAQGADIQNVVIVGAPDPSVVKRATLYDPTQPNDPFVIQVAGNPLAKLALRQGNILLNNSIKQACDAHLAQFTNLGVNLLYVHSPDFLTATDLNSIHPNKIGQQKIGRAILNACLYQGRRLGPLAIPHPTVL